MKAQSNTRPEQVVVEQNGDVILSTNIVEVVKDDGIQYAFDSYRINVPYRDGLQNRVIANFAEWLAKAKGQEELETAVVTNKSDIADKLKEAITDNKTYLALTAPTTAQNTAELKKLARQNNRIIRRLLQQFDFTD